MPPNAETPPARGSSPYFHGTPRNVSGPGHSAVDFVSCREEYLTSPGPFRDMLVGILATIANVEIVGMSERIKARIARRERLSGAFRRKSNAAPPRETW